MVVADDHAFLVKQKGRSDHVIAHPQVNPTVEVGVEKGAANAEGFHVQTGFCGHIGERAVAVVAEQIVGGEVVESVHAPSGHIHVGVPVAVVVGGADANGVDVFGGAQSSGKAYLFKGAVAQVSVQPVAQTAAGHIQVLPAVAVEVKPRHAATHVAGCFGLKIDARGDRYLFKCLGRKPLRE